MSLRIDLLVVSHADIIGKQALSVANRLTAVRAPIIQIMLVLLIVNALSRQQTLRRVRITWRTNNGKSCRCRQNKLSILQSLANIIGSRFN